MKLFEYIYMKRQENKKFTITSFAKEIGIDRFLMSKIISGKKPSAKVALKIEEVTNGQVSGWELMKIGLENERKKTLKNVDKSKQEKP